MSSPQRRVPIRLPRLICTKLLCLSSRRKLISSARLHSCFPLSPSLRPRTRFLHGGWGSAPAFVWSSMRPVVVGPIVPQAACKVTLQVASRSPRRAVCSPAPASSLHVAAVMAQGLVNRKQWRARTLLKPLCLARRPAGPPASESPPPAAFLALLGLAVFGPQLVRLVVVGYQLAAGLGSSAGRGGSCSGGAWGGGNWGGDSGLGSGGGGGGGGGGNRGKEKQGASLARLEACFLPSPACCHDCFGSLLSSISLC